MKDAIVVGGNGFIGSALCKCLLKHGINVIAIVRNSDSDVSRIARLPVHVVCGNQKSLLDIADSSENDRVLFYAAWDGVSGSARGNIKIQLDNIKSMTDMVSVAKDLGCSRFVGIGSLAEKDVERYAKADGSTPGIVSHYGTAKIAAHYMTKAESASVGIEHIWVQLANVYGRGDRSRNFINYVIDMLMKGKDADFTSGKQYYDFIHISDAAEGLYQAGFYGKANHNYYIGSGNPWRLRDYIMAIKDMVDPGIKINFGAKPYYGLYPQISDFDTTQIERDTGFLVQIRFEDGVKERIQEYMGEMADEI